MTISPERLAELRAMPYEEYLLTPEWLATRKRIIKRDHYECQGCHIRNVVFNVHHYTYIRLGEELDEDLVTLCEECHKELHRLMKGLPKIPFLYKCGVGVGAALIGTIGIEGFLQAPLPAEVGVLIVAFLLAKNSPKVYARLKEMVPAEVLAWLGEAPKEGKASTLDIWFGRTPKRVIEAKRESKKPDESAEEDVDARIVRMPDIRPDDETVSFDNETTDDDDPLLLPGEHKRMTLFSELLKSGWRPRIDQIYVGTDTQGRHLFVAAKDLCHVALAGATGHGKSSLLRLLLAQLCYLKLPVVLLNPHYMIFDKDHHEDWTPYTPYLKKDPMVYKEIVNIETMLKWMAEDLLERRKERTSRGESAGKPFFFILDEYPDIKAEIKDAPKYVGKILRQGRKYGIFLIVASQDFSVKTLGVEGEGAVRKCFLTTFYVGGDGVSAKELLNTSIRDIPENDLGRGTIMLKCAVTANPVLVHVPYVDNESLSLLLGPSTYEGKQQREIHTDMIGGNINEAMTILRQGTTGAPHLRIVESTVTGNDGGQDAQNSPEMADFDRYDRNGYDRNGEAKPAPEEAVRGQNEAVTPVSLPPGWTEEKIALLPGLYRVFEELDSCLKGLEFSTSQRNRDFARDILKQQGLWKEK